MNGKNVIIGALAVISAVFIFYFIQERKKNELSVAKIKKLEQERLKLIKDSLKKADIPQEIKDQILRLINEYKDIDPNVADKLLDVLSLIEIGQKDKAIMDMAIIIENLLAEKFKNEEKFKGIKKYIPLGNLIEYAKQIKFFNSEEYNASCILRDIRNKVAHKLGVKYGVNWQIIGILGGIEIIFKLKGVKAK